MSEMILFVLCTRYTVAAPRDGRYQRDFKCFLFCAADYVLFMHRGVHWKSNTVFLIFTKSSDQGSLIVTSSGTGYCLLSLRLVVIH